jgi:hypothetical protein
MEILGLQRTTPSGNFRGEMNVGVSEISLRNGSQIDEKGVMTSDEYGPWRLESTSVATRSDYVARLEPFENAGGAHASADAHRDHAITCVAAL